MRDRTENQVALVMIRHGAAKSNWEHRYLGTTEEPLCEEGIEELMQYREQGCYPKIDRLFVSPMVRCLQTAEILYPTLTPICIDEWREIDFGAFEGKNHRELQEDVRYQKWIDSGGTLPFPQGKTEKRLCGAACLGLKKCWDRLLNGKETESRKASAWWCMAGQSCRSFPDTAAEIISITKRQTGEGFAVIAVGEMGGRS